MNTFHHLNGVEQKGGGGMYATSKAEEVGEEELVLEL